MTSDKISQIFQKYPDLRVLFFFDANREYEDSVARNLPDDVELVRYAGNDFTLKLHFRTNPGRTLLYLPQAAPTTPDALQRFALVDTLVANRVLQLDNVSELVETFRLQAHQRGLVEQYRRELQYASTQKILHDILTPERFDEAAVVRGLLSVALKFSQVEEWPVLLVRLMNLGHRDRESDFSRISVKVAAYNWLEPISHQFRKWLGQSLDRFAPDELTHLAQRLKYNALTPAAGNDISSSDPYRRLRLTDHRAQQQINQWVETVRNYPKSKVDWLFLLTETAADVREDALVNCYGALTAYPLLTPALKWAILSALAPEVSEQPTTVLSALEPLRPGQEGDQELGRLLLVQSLDMLRWCAGFFDELNRIITYTLDSPDDYLNEYTTRWYQVDLAYRKAMTAFRAIDETEIPDGFPFCSLCDQVNKAYHPFLEQANREWLRCLQGVGFDYSLLQAPKSYEFFDREIGEPTQKVAVLISDALRYEVAAELLNDLNTDSKTVANLHYQLASLPSKTSVGMADLLPGKTARYDERTESILVDGLPTGSVAHRQQVLQRTLAEARAVDFDDVDKNPQEQNRDLFKSRLVYIYHDLIDAIGDKKASERQAFGAVEATIDSLRRAIKKIHSSFNVAKVIVTADHGFLYTDQTVPDKDLQKASGLSALITHNRYELVNESTQPELAYSIPLRRVSRLQDNYYVIIPQSVNRFRKQGVGHQFVHGGGSLQELVVPVLISTRKEKPVSQRVTPMLVNRNGLRVVSNVLKAVLLQEQKVSPTYKPRTVVMAMYQDFEPVSNKEERILDATSDNPTERSLTITLTLLRASSVHLRLKLFDKDDTAELNPLIDEPVRNETLIQSDF